MGADMKSDKPIIQLSLSSEWLHHDPNLSIESFCQLGKQMGFDSFDFGPSTTEARLEDRELREFPISSFHAPLFLPLSDLKKLTSAETELGSLNQALRMEAVDAICRTIDLAHSLGITTIAVHVGTVNMPTESYKRLHAMYDADLQSSDEYQSLAREILQRRNKIVEPQLEAAVDSLQIIGRRAAEMGVHVGLENRCEQTGMPNFDDMQVLLSEVSNYPIGFWFDLGHAAVQENLGFIAHTKWIDTFSDRIIGIHIHDVIGRKDHLAPGTGNLNWQTMVAQLPQEPVWVFECSRDVAAKQVAEGTTLIHSILGQ